MEPALRLVTTGPEETREVGTRLAELLAAGDVVSLSGDLGAGKTTFVQGAARGLGVEQPVVSPTFVLIREYQGRLPVLHVDVYRLDRVQDVVDLGLEDMVGEEAVTFVEWGDAIERLLPESSLEVRLSIDEAEEPVRRLVLRGPGPSWAARWARLSERLDPWREGRAC